MGVAAQCKVRQMHGKSRTHGFGGGGGGGARAERTLNMSSMLETFDVSKFSG